MTMTEIGVSTITDLGFPIAIVLLLFWIVIKGGTWFGKNFILEVKDAVKVFLSNLTKHNSSIEKITGSLSVQMDHNTEWLKKNAEATQTSTLILERLTSLHENDDSKFSTVHTNEKLETLETKIDTLTGAIQSK